MGRPHRDRNSFQMAVERCCTVCHERAQLGIVDRQHASALSYTVDVNVTRKVRKSLKRMCQFATNIRVRLDELALAQENRKGEGDLVELAENLQQSLDVRRSKLVQNSATSSKVQEVSRFTYPDERRAAVAYQSCRFLTVEHELAQDFKAEQDDSADVVSPPQDFIPARAIVRHVTKAFIFEEVKEVVYCSFALESNADSTAEAWASSHGQVRLLTDGTKLGHCKALQCIEAR
jgi:hypothetical protein